MTDVVTYDNMDYVPCALSGRQMTRKTRPVSWIRAALKEFEKFPEGARSICLAALTIAAEGGKADGLRGAVCRRSLGCACVSKKSTQGIKTPKREIDVIKHRLKRLKDLLL